MTTLWPSTGELKSKYRQMSLLERLDLNRARDQFRVVWVDDRGRCRSTAHGAMQFCSSFIGRRTGGMRFPPSVNLFHSQIPRLRSKPLKCPDYSADGRW